MQNAAEYSLLPGILLRRTPEEQKASRIKLGFNGATVLVVEGQKKWPKENHKMDLELGQREFVLRVSFATYIQNTIPGKRTYRVPYKKISRLLLPPPIK